MNDDDFDEEEVLIAASLNDYDDDDYEVESQLPAHNRGDFEDDMWSNSSSEPTSAASSEQIHPQHLFHHDDEEEYSNSDIIGYEYADLT